MIQITPQTRILVAVEPADFRKGIDGMAQLCRAALCEDPFSGAVFVFRNKRRTSIKLLIYDGRGFWLCQMRLSSGRFRCWPDAEGSSAELEAHQLMVLCSGGDPYGAPGAPIWRDVAPRRHLAV